MGNEQVIAGLNQIMRLLKSNHLNSAPHLLQCLRSRAASSRPAALGHEPQLSGAGAALSLPRAAPQAAPAAPLLSEQGKAAAPNLPPPARTQQETHSIYEL